MTYLWPDGFPITVRADSTGTPQLFQWQGHSHPVQEVTKCWRVDEEWWQERIWREYFKLYTTTGLLVIIYQDLINKQWFLLRRYA